MAIFKRFPKLEQVIPVYAVIVLMLYTWTIMWFFWKLPSWLFFMNAAEILMAFTYSITTNFIESLVVLCMPVLLCVLLPRKWFYDLFVARGTAFVVAALGYMMFIAFLFQTKNDYPSLFLKGWSLALAAGIIVLIVFLAGKIGVSKKILEGVADRASIFLYITIPVSILAVLVILIHSVM